MDTRKDREDRKNYRINPRMFACRPFNFAAMDRSPLERNSVDEHAGDAERGCWQMSRVGAWKFRDDDNAVNGVACSPTSEQTPIGGRVSRSHRGHIGHTVLDEQTAAGTVDREVSVDSGTNALGSIRPRHEYVFDSFYFRVSTTTAI